MKKVLKVIGVLFLLGIAAVGIIWWYSRTSNPWNAKCVGDISTPVGYTRVNGSYAEFMRSLPLKKRGSKVQLYMGGDLQNPPYAKIHTFHTLGFVITFQILLLSLQIAKAI